MTIRSLAATSLLFLAALPVLPGCKDKAADTAEGEDGADPDDTGDDTGGFVEPASSFSGGQYRVVAFSIEESSTVGLDIDGDGVEDNKLPSVLSTAALLTGQPLSVDELNATIEQDLAKNNIVLLTELAHDTSVSGGELTVDVLLGAVAGTTISVDPASYDEASGEPRSRFVGQFSSEAAFQAETDSAALPFPLLPGSPPVLIPLEMVKMDGMVDGEFHSGVMGGAIPVDAFVDQVIDPIIPTGKDYDPEDYLDMEREEFIEFIRETANGEGVADITLSDGRKAVSAAVNFTASPSSWE